MLKKAIADEYITRCRHVFYIKDDFLWLEAGE